ncbi:hypothetical protein GCM10023205_04400 [Yinghuangia aomiensis]|uniref:TrbL/VirB6 plasmid conjugal transfer protein n=1 Tax=Yinghuangia aomiensis TaxID=676205 RepID=A0ABP9GNZ8_9ACTN
MGVCDVPLVDKVCGVVGGVVEATGQAITDGIGAWIAKSMGELAASSADLAARAVDTTTAVDLNASWFRSNYELLLPIGLILIVATFCAQLTRAAIRRDEQALSQAVAGTVVGVMFQFGAIAFTSVALTVVDALSAGVFAASGTNIEAAVRRIVQVSAFGAMFPLGWAVPALVALVLAICMFIYWGVMVFRKVAILILVTLAVFAGAGGGWEAARRWRRGWVEATATLVVSKLLMTIVFALGVAAMGQSNTSDGLSALSDALAGVVVMCLVLMCPLITFKFVHWADESANGADLTTSAGAGAATAYGAAKKTAGKAKAMMARPAGGAAVPGASNGIANGIPAGRAPFGPPPAADSGRSSGGTSGGKEADAADGSAESGPKTATFATDAVSKLAAAGAGTTDAAWEKPDTSGHDTATPPGAATSPTGPDNAPGGGTLTTAPSTLAGTTPPPAGGATPAAAAPPPRNIPATANLATAAPAGGPVAPAVAGTRTGSAGTPRSGAPAGPATAPPTGG